MLRNESQQRQNQVVGRVWSAIGIKPGEVSDDLFGEWKEALGGLSMLQIERGVAHWKQKGRTCPADEFAKSCESKLTPAQVVEKARKLYGETEMTFAQAYEHLGLHRRWGPLDKDDPRLNT